MKRLQYLVYVLLFLVLFVGILILGREFFVPIALAVILSMLLVGFSNWLERKGIKRGFSALISVVSLLLFIALILAFLTWQLKDFSSQLDEMQKRLVGFLDQVRTWLNANIGISKNEQKKMVEQSQSGDSGAGKMAFSFASGLMGMLVNTVLVTVYLYLLLFYRSHIKKSLIKIVPRGTENNAVEIVNQSVNVSRQYLGGLAIMICMLWVMYGIGFSIVGVKSAIFFAVLCGLLEIIPFIGNITGTVITLLAVTAQGGDGKMLIGVAVVYLFVQFIQTYIIEPLVVGKQVNINPLFTIMALVVGELIWGIAGMVLAIPMLGMVKILCDHVPSLQPYGYLIGGEEAEDGKPGFGDQIKTWFKKKKN